MFYTYSWLLTLVLNHKSYGTFMFIYNYFLIGAWMKRKSQIADAFNLHLLEITFVYQFYSRKTTLVESTFWKTVGPLSRDVRCCSSNKMLHIGFPKSEVNFSITLLSIKLGDPTSEDNFFGSHSSKITEYVCSWQNNHKESKKVNLRKFWKTCVWCHFRFKHKIVPKGLPRHSIKARQFSILQY